MCIRNAMMLATAKTAKMTTPKRRNESPQNFVMVFRIEFTDIKNNTDTELTNSINAQYCKRDYFCQELHSGQMLYEEGNKLNHCVITYTPQCKNGICTIWSLMNSQCRWGRQCTFQIVYILDSVHCRQCTLQMVYTVDCLGQIVCTVDDVQSI